MNAFAYVEACGHVVHLESIKVTLRKLTPILPQFENILSRLQGESAT